MGILRCLFGSLFNLLSVQLAVLAYLARLLIELVCSFHFTSLSKSFYILMSLSNLLATFFGVFSSPKSIVKVLTSARCRIAPHLLYHSSEPLIIATYRRFYDQILINFIDIDYVFPIYFLRHETVKLLGQ